MVIITEQVKTDLNQIYDFIKKTSPLYASELIEVLVEKIEGLEKFPERGRSVPELQDNAVREIIHNPFRIIYEVHPDNVYILGIIHGKRDFNAAFTDRNI